MKINSFIENYIVLLFAGIISIWFSGFTISDMTLLLWIALILLPAIVSIIITMINNKHQNGDNQ